MPHTVWDLGSLTSAQRIQPRQFVAGIEPGRGVVIGRSREPKPMILLQDAWIQVNRFDATQASVNQGSYSLALGKDPLNDALLLPIGRVWSAAPGTTRPEDVDVEQMFRAQGTMWAAKYIAIDFAVDNALVTCDVDVHLDWEVTTVDWWTWFVAWNRLEASPDGSLIDGERAYA